MFTPGDRPVLIEDVAHHLAQTNRFGGAAPFPYSVAQHSILVSIRASELARDLRRPASDVRIVALQGLLHDAAEAIVGDIMRPLKPRLSVPDLLVDFEALENLWLTAILRQFRCPEVLFPEVIRADDELLATEARELFPSRPADWGLRCEPLPFSISRWSFESARASFLERFVELGGVP